MLELPRSNFLQGELSPLTYPHPMKPHACCLCEVRLKCQHLWPGFSACFATAFKEGSTSLPATMFLIGPNLNTGEIFVAVPGLLQATMVSIHFKT